MKFDVKNTYERWGFKFNSHIPWHDLDKDIQSFWIKYHFDCLEQRQPTIYDYPAN